MAENLFCVQLTIFVFIWMYILDYCPVGRSNDDPILVSWQEQPDSNEKCPGLSIEFMMLCTLTSFPGPLEKKKVPQHHGTSISTLLAYRLFSV